MSAITAYQAVFGQRGFTHALLAQTPGCDAFASLGTIEADLPGEAPAGVVWQPFVRGWPVDAYYLFALTASDPSATRPGMVRTRLLAVPLAHISEIADLTAIWSSLENPWNGETILAPVVIEHENSPKIENRPPSSELLEIAMKLTAGIAENAPVVLNGQDRFRERVTELWQRMPAPFRREMIFGFTFIPSDLKQRQLHLACCPAGLAERWREYANFVRFDVTQAEVTPACGYLLGLSEGSAIERFLSEAHLIQPTLRTIAGYVRAAADWSKREKLDFNGLCSLARDIAQFAPQPEQAAEMKVKLMDSLAVHVRDGDAGGILPLRNLRVSAFGVGVKALGNAVKGWIESRLRENTGPDDENLLKVLKAMSRPASPEWEGWVSEGIAAAISSTDERVATNLWYVWCQEESLFDKFAPTIPEDATRERIWKKTTPAKLSESLGGKVIAWCRARRWWLMNAAVLLAFNPWEDAVDAQLSEAPKTGGEEAIRLLMEAAPFQTAVCFAVGESDPRVRQCAAAFCVDRPIALDEFAANDAGWRDILLRALSIDAQIVRRIPNAGLIIVQLLDALLAGVGVDEKILAAFAKTESANLVDYHARPKVWAALPPAVQRDFLAATAVGWLTRFLVSPNSAAPPEPALRTEVFGASLKGRRFQSQGSNSLVHGLALFRTFPEANEECFIEWLDAVAVCSQRLNSTESAEIAALLKLRGWETAARRLRAHGEKPGRDDISRTWDGYWNSLGKIDKLFFRLFGSQETGHYSGNRSQWHAPMAPKKSSALFVTALEAEFKAVLSHLDDVEEKESKGSVYAVGQFHSGNASCEVVVAQAGMGNPKTAMETERAIERFSPKYAFFVGISGGLKEELKIGDVVAADKVYGYEPGKASDKLRPRVDAPWTSYASTQRAQAVAREDKWIKRIIPPPSACPRAFVKPVAAGEKIIDSHQTEVFRLLKENCSDAYVVAMEDLGFSYAAHANPNVTFAVVRGVSDFAVNKAQAEENDSQGVAARHAAAFAFEMLAGFLEAEHSSGLAKLDTVHL